MGLVHRACWLAVSVCIVAWVSCSPAAAQSADHERITSFHSDIKINQDGSLAVTETIKVAVQGLEIKYGIFRDFPTKYKDAEGNPVTIWFEIEEVRRNGVSEPFTTSSLSNGIRIRIGDAEVYLPHEEHTYTIMYNTRRQLGFFAEHDELYWNVTGNGWGFPIDKASARIELPADVAANSFRLKAFTGAFGSRGSDTEMQIEGPRVAKFESSAGLGRYEGLTILAQWPKGIVSAPTPTATTGYWLVDHLMLLVVPLGLLIIFVYLWRAWVRVGRDPEGGFVTPEPTAPRGLTPAAVYYIRHMSAGTKAFTAALVNMALQGYLRIDEDEDFAYTVVKLGEKDETLSAEERAIANHLFAAGDSLLVKQANQPTIARALTAMKSSLKRQYEGVFFVLNRRELLRGLLLSGGILLIWIILVVNPYVGFKPMIVPAVIGIIGLQILFWLLMPAYTMLGRMTLDKIEGFKLALAGGTDDLGDEHLGSKILVEENLPFAIALEVHHTWAKRFEAAMQARQPRGQTTTGQYMYLPTWYRSSDSSHSSQGFEYSKFTSNLASSFSSSVSSASTPPGSSSGSGGSSGGGGGGGGGGGW